MREEVAVSTDDLVNSLLDSVTSGSLSSTASSATNTTAPFFAPVSLSTTASLSGSSSATTDTEAPSTTDAPAPISPVTPAPLPEGSSKSPDDTAANGSTKTKSNTHSVGLATGISLGVLVIIIAVVFFMRSRRKRVQKDQALAATPTADNTPINVPSDRGFKRERELGIPEMSIELAPGELGMSKGFDTSYTSSNRSSGASQQYNLSLAGSGSGLFNTKGGVSPTSSAHKVSSYSYQYRESEEKGTGKNNHSTASSTTFHLTGLIGHGTTSSGRGPSHPSRNRKLSAPDEYAELNTATNAKAHLNMGLQDQSHQGSFGVYTHSRNDLDISMGPDEDNYNFLGPLPSKAPSSRFPKRPVMTNLRASEESMCPDSPVAGRGKRTNSVYDTIPNLAGEKMSASSRTSVENLHARSTTSFMSQSSVSSASTRDSTTTSSRSSAYLPAMPLMSQLSSTTDKDGGEKLSSQRASTECNTTRSGSLIALNLDAKDGSEIAI